VEDIEDGAGRAPTLPPSPSRADAVSAPASAERAVEGFGRGLTPWSTTPRSEDVALTGENGLLTGTVREALGLERT